MMYFRTILTFLFLIPLLSLNAQQAIPSDRVVDINQLKDFLSDDVKNELSQNGSISEASLASYFRQKFSERYFYDWQKFEDRFELYNATYNNFDRHHELASNHMQKFADSTKWLLPFDYLNGEEVNAYALRHLARQHKMVDVAYMYFYENKDPKYIDYFVKQRSSLNYALENNLYESIENGNGVYEAFRSGYRALNWLSIHTMFLGEETYTDKEQLITIATLLQHGADLYESNTKFRSGNHQTRGMSALAMLSILLRDFEGTDLWHERSMKILEEHLSREINEDGFQFERSVHYHISDIENYFYVYQLAQISDVEVNKAWEDQLKSLFTTLVKIAYPNKSAPVLQDDTNDPWAETNEISGAASLGYLLFEDPEFGFLASDRIARKLYWFLQSEQLDKLKSIASKTPTYGSLYFPTTKYYIMREGWDEANKMMLISAGLDADKPDHQHGDMLGIQAMANGHVILPNYQVRYSLPDYDFFKNSMVKNVALVDDELQGKAWTGNRGGSGFGKFKKLPLPETIVWQSNTDYDLFAGSHDGFEDVGVYYSRQVIYVKDDFWIVKDNFSSEDTHSYKQVWQGHYTDEEGPNLIRSTFSNASGCDIYQLNETDGLNSSGKRGKEWSVVSKSGKRDFSFITLVYPYQGYNQRIDENSENAEIRNWKIDEHSFHSEGNAVKSLSKDDESYFFNVESLSLDKLQIELSSQADLYLKTASDTVTIRSIGTEELDIQIKGCKTILLNNTPVKGQLKLKPGDEIVCIKMSLIHK